MLDGATYNPRWTGDVKAYVEGKVKFANGFCVALTEREIKYLESLQTQIRIDNAVQTMIDHRYGW